jgi:hypothetical protein
MVSIAFGVGDLHADGFELRQEAAQLRVDGARGLNLEDR